MSAHFDPALSDLARVRSLFEQWRARRSSPNQRLPQELWDAAATLLDHFPIGLVARELRLSAPRLRQQRELLVPPSAPHAPRPHFVPLPAPPSAAPAPPGELLARLVLERPDGARLSLALPVEHAGRFDALARAFLDPRP